MEVVIHIEDDPSLYNFTITNAKGSYDSKHTVEEINDINSKIMKIEASLSMKDANTLPDLSSAEKEARLEKWAKKLLLKLNFLKEPLKHEVESFFGMAEASTVKAAAPRDNTKKVGAGITSRMSTLDPTKMIHPIGKPLVLPKPAQPDENVKSVTSVSDHDLTTILLDRARVTNKRRPTIKYRTNSLIKIKPLKGHGDFPLRDMSTPDDPHQDSVQSVHNEDMMETEETQVDSIDENIADTSLVSNITNHSNDQNDLELDHQKDDNAQTEDNNHDMHITEVNKIPQAIEGDLDPSSSIDDNAGIGKEESIVEDNSQEIITEDINDKPKDPDDQNQLPSKEVDENTTNGVVPIGIIDSESNITTLLQTSTDHDASIEFGSIVNSATPSNDADIDRSPVEVFDNVMIQENSNSHADVNDNTNLNYQEHLLNVDQKNESEIAVLNQTEKTEHLEEPSTDPTYSSSQETEKILPNEKSPDLPLQLNSEESHSDVDQLETDYEDATHPEAEEVQISETFNSTNLETNVFSSNYREDSTQNALALPPQEEKASSQSEIINDHISIITQDERVQNEEMTTLSNVSFETTEATKEEVQNQQNIANDKQTSINPRPAKVQVEDEKKTDENLERSTPVTNHSKSFCQQICPIC